MDSPYGSLRSWLDLVDLFAGFFPEVGYFLPDGLDSFSGCLVEDLHACVQVLDVAVDFSVHICEFSG